MPRYYNTTFGPLVWNDEGQIIGGGEWFTVDKPTQQIKEYLANMKMVEVPVQEESKPKTRRTRRSKKQEDTQE